MDIKDVKPAMANKTKVKFEGTDYTITACILRLIDRQWQYTVELKDLKAKSSVVVVNLEKVEVE